MSAIAVPDNNDPHKTAEQGLAQKFSINTENVMYLAARVDYPEALKELILKFADYARLCDYQTKSLQNALKAGTLDVFRQVQTSQTSAEWRPKIDVVAELCEGMAGDWTSKNQDYITDLVEDRIDQINRYHNVRIMRAELLEKIGAVWHQQHGFSYVHVPVPNILLPDGEPYSCLQMPSEVAQLYDECAFEDRRKIIEEAERQQRIQRIRLISRGVKIDFQP